MALSRSYLQSGDFTSIKTAVIEHGEVKLNQDLLLFSFKGDCDSSDTFYCALALLLIITTNESQDQSKVLLRRTCMILRYINYLFLKDYIDQGHHTLKTICLIIALKVEV